MPSQIAISIIIPCFNAGPYLADAVRSVMEQGVPEVEVLIVDDVSSDDSLAVAEALAQDNPAVRVLRQSMNSGPAPARNLGLRNARGRYVCFLDADDSYAPGFFRGVLPQLDAHPELAAVITGIELVDCDRPVHPVQMRAIVMSSPSNLLIRRSVAELLGGLPVGDAFRGKSGGEDAIFRMALDKFFRIAFVKNQFLRYLVRPHSHLHFFLDRSTVVDGKLMMTQPTHEEESGAMGEAYQAYIERVQERLTAAACLKETAV